MTTLLLVRHGESEANREDIFAGHLNADLMPKGMIQAQKTAEYIAQNYTVDKVYASDLKRAYKTGECISQRLNTEIIPDERLREIDAGEWDGVKFNNIGNINPVEFHIWLNDIGNAFCPGGETVKELNDRIVGVMTEIAQNNDGKTIVVATHATPVRVMQNFVENGDLEKMQSIGWVSNASVSVFEYEDGNWSCIKISEDRHLGELVTFLPDNV